MFTKATKEKSKLKLAIHGIAGSGKTYSSLLMATGLGKKIALIDTEAGRASKYSNKFNFDTHIENDPTIDNMIKGINGAIGYDVLIIDSLSHCWQSLVLQVENLAQSRFKGNTWAAWSKGTPKQKELVKAILTYPGHLIATMRVKSDWVIDGKQPVKVGLNPEAGKGIEYEFDVVMDINQDHTAFFSKDITEIYQNKSVQKPSKEVGEKFREWFDSGEEVKVKDKEESVFSICKREIEEAKSLEELKKARLLVNKNLGKIKEVDGQYMELSLLKDKKKREFDQINTVFKDVISNQIKTIKVGSQ